jgi:uncharacterized membrane protein YhiD involved in acid resistance
MEAIHNINLTSLLDTLISLAAAFVLGGLIGFERQYRQRTAGLRTNVLVAVGAALFVDMANLTCSQISVPRQTNKIRATQRKRDAQE